MIVRNEKKTKTWKSRSRSRKGGEFCLQYKVLSREMEIWVRQL